MASFIPRKGPGGKRVWQAHVRRRGYPAQVRTFDTKAEAEAWAATIESEIARGVFVSRAEAEATSLAEALDRYAVEVVPRKRSGTRELSTITSWRSSALGTRPMASVRGKDVAAAIRDMEGRGLSPNTIRLHLALLSHLFNTARTAWGMESLSNPVDLVKGQRPKLPQGRTRRLVDDEQARLLAAAKAYDSTPHAGGNVGPIITWAIETAMRRGEIAAMRWEHLNIEGRALLLPETKNGTPREVPLSKVALAVLDGLPRRPDGRVWGMRPDSISQAFERVCKAAGIEGLTFHDLRHEATSRLFEKGLGDMQVAAITGHKTQQMLKRYTHLRAKDLAPLLD
ncbi:site-specific integrase [Acidiferrobacter thiooxydans]|uniref:integrase n=1 Tax=Acidiferrobacter thiooxydans TaxID=163359 RepID=UPI000825506E|nr:site-specific integrase [Acidiferrobacter thiooxydans]UEO00418.1 site-specific integrase [Acidiferrobacter thiooxydans]